MNHLQVIFTNNIVIGDLVQKISVQNWVNLYEANYKKGYFTFKISTNC